MIQLDTIATKDEVRADLQKALDRAADRKIIYTRLAQVLEKYDGKKIRKNIEKDIQKVMPPSWDVWYVFDEPVYRKLVFRLRYGSKEVFKEVVTVHCEHYGETYSHRRFMDSDNRTAHCVAEIVRLKALLADLDEQYDAIYAALEVFTAAHAEFRDALNERRDYVYHFDAGAADYMREAIQLAR